MKNILEYVDNFDAYFLDSLEDFDELKVYKFQDYDIKWLRRLLKFGEDSLGNDTFDVFSIVFQIYYGNVFIVKEGNSSNKIQGLAAFSRAWDDDDLVYLSDFAIGEDARGKSIGTRFMKLVLKNIKDQGFNRVKLTVSPDNIGAVTLYEKTGFNIVETVEELYGPNADRHIMELEL